jgi:hypothetical protein
VIRTVLTGRVTDDEILAYYQSPVFLEHAGRWLELVDGLGITEMAITAGGLWKLTQVVAARREMLRGGRVAMVAGSAAAYGMFRMWEMQRETMPYEVRVFRDRDEALAWLRAEPASVA